MLKQIKQMVDHINKIYVTNYDYQIVDHLHCLLNQSNDEKLYFLIKYFLYNFDKK